MRKYILAGALVASAIVPAAASAGFMDEFDAADQVQRVATYRYHFDALASCRTIGRSKYTCSVSGTKSGSNTCFYQGRANVQRRSQYIYKVTSLHVSRTCF